MIFPFEIWINIFENISTDQLIRCVLVSKYFYETIMNVIEYLEITCNNKIMDKHLVIFQKAKKINLKFCRLITDDGLCNLFNAKEVNLWGCSVTGYGLSKLKSVEHINLVGCTINQQHLDWMCNLKSVVHFNKFNVARIKNKKYELINYNIKKLIRHQHKADCINVIAKALPNLNVPNETDEAETKIHKWKNIKLFQNVYYDRSVSDMIDYLHFLPHEELFGYDEAKKKLLSYNNIKKFISITKLYNLDILIGGSTPLSCVYKKANFVPNDLDIYIKHINKKKLLLIEKIIYRAFNIQEIVVVRNVITMTWYIKLVNDEIFIVQTNIMEFDQWDQVFVTYHNDLTCIGYEILSDRFICFPNRWKNILKNKVHYFSNALNGEIEESLKNATQKYIKRGFDCKYIYYDQSTFYNSSDGTIPKPTSFDNSNLIFYLKEKYFGTKCVFASTVDKLYYNEENPPHLIIITDKKYTKKITNINLGTHHKKMSYYYDNLFRLNDRSNGSKVYVQCSKCLICRTIGGFIQDCIFFCACPDEKLSDCYKNYKLLIM